MDGAWPAIRFTPLTQEAHAYPVQASMSRYRGNIAQGSLIRSYDEYLRHAFSPKKARGEAKWQTVPIQNRACRIGLAKNGCFPRAPICLVRVWTQNV